MITFIALFCLNTSCIEVRTRTDNCAAVVAELKTHDLVDGYVLRELSCLRE